MSRFWAWNTYVPFSLAVSLTFFGHYTAASVVLAILLGVVPVHLLLNQLEWSRRTSATAPTRNLPESKFLQFLIGFSAGGILYQLFLSLRSNATLNQKIGNFITDLAAPWMFGSFASQIGLVVFASVVAAVVYFVSVTPVRPGTAMLAKMSLAFLLGISLFTIWVTSSELDSVESVAGFAVEVLLKSFIKIPIDLVISLVWFVGLFQAYSDIDREKRRFDESLDSEHPPLPMSVQIGLPVAGWLSFVGALLLGVVRA